ncbi:MAG: helix-turn-helix domain-containing protein, partial [Gemmatimonadota bacterium]
LHRGIAVSREQLLQEVWGYSEPERIRTRTVDTHVAALRAKLERDPSAPEHILTVRKVGYRLEG